MDAAVGGNGEVENNVVENVPEGGGRKSHRNGVVNWKK
jgi:hypothetical protein